MPQWVIRVNFKNGAVGWLRHGPVVGSGPIVRFRSKRTADVNLDFVKEGLDAGDTASVVRVADNKPRDEAQKVPD